MRDWLPIVLLLGLIGFGLSIVALKIAFPP